MNKEIENLITAKNEIFKKHLKNNQNRYYTYKYKALQRTLENVIESSKQSYYKRVSHKLFSKQSYYKKVSHKLSSISTNFKFHWSLLKRLNDKKIL